MFRKTLLALLLAASGVSAHADTISQWNFNGAPNLNSPAAAIGNGTASLIGGTSAATASGSPNDPTSVSDFRWNVSSFTAQGTNDKTAGALFAVSTVGYQDITVSLDLRNSNSSSRSVAFQYTTDGLTFNDFATVQATAGDQWNTRSFDLSALTATDKNASFAFRLVTAMENGAYVAARSTSSYATTSTLGFDMVTVSGTIAAVPEPENYALFLAGLGLMGAIARRRSFR